MGFTLGIIFAIIALLGWGTADFLAAIATRKVGAVKTLFFAQLVGLVPLLFVFPVFFDFPVFSLKMAGLVIFTGVMQFIAYLSFFKGFAVGIVSVVSPISSCWVVVTLILSVAFLGEKIGLLQGIGTALAVSGVILASFRLKDLLKFNIKKEATGIDYAFAAMLGWGIMMVLVPFLVRIYGWFIPVFLIRVLVVVFLAPLMLSSKKANYSRLIIVFLAFSGILDVVSFLLFGYAVNVEQNTIVSPIVAMFPAVTMVLSRIFLKERLSLNQKIGLVGVLAGIVVLSL